jgi:RND family efflux transporter MFP subunit
MRYRKRHIALFVFLPAAILAGVTGCGRPSEPSAPANIPATVRATTAVIEEVDAPLTYTVTGTVRSMFTSSLSSKVMGRIVAVNVREGDAIRQGQMLVTIDGRELKSAVEMADADYRAAVAGAGSARTAADMEVKSSAARIAQAEAQVKQAEAGLAAAEARRDLAVAGSRNQELEQARIAVAQAQSSLRLAQVELDRVTKLVEDGALARRELDVAQNRFDLAKGQYDAAVQTESMAREGSRAQEIRAANEGVTQAKAALKQAQAGLAQARAAAMQIDLRRKDYDLASARTLQAAAAAISARVSLSYVQIPAPFDGRVTARLADPGTLASPGVPILQVEGGDFRFEAEVPESLLGSLSKGKTAEVRIDALGGQALTGRVVEVVPTADAGSHRFTVKFALQATRDVKSGMFGKAVLVTGTVRRIVIPKTATWQREGLNYVFIVNSEGIARLRIVTLGEVTNGDVEVLSGLGKGDRIVVGDRTGINDGAKVEQP